MATSDQIKALIRSHFSDSTEQFLTIALQVAAHEAMAGHIGLAQEIRDLVDRSKKKSASRNVLSVSEDLNGLLVIDEAGTPISSLVVNESLSARIDRVILEFYQRGKLKSHGLSHRRKLLLTGPPGTGKTMTARVLARELKVPLFTIQVDRLVTKFLGETAAKLRLIFDRMHGSLGVFLFDEFDAIGGERDMGNDVGEMRRILNSFLQFIENDTTDNIVIAATNNQRLLDRALFRRFDDVLQYNMPTSDERSRLIASLLGVFQLKRFSLQNAADCSNGLSHAEISSACLDAIKQAILQNKNGVSMTAFKAIVEERRMG